MNLERLEEILSTFPNHRIAVLGDFFLDKYLVTDPALSEISIETGLEARQVVSIRRSPGAAGTVTNNLSALGIGEILAVGAIGLDGEGDDLIRGLEATGVKTKSLLRCGDLFTPTYLKTMRMIPGGEEELERSDTKNRKTTHREIEDAVIANLYETFDQQHLDAIIVLDQVQERNFGIVTDLVRETVCDIANRFPNILVFCDSRCHIGKFYGGWLKPNLSEVCRALGNACSESPTINDLSDAATSFARTNQARVFLTAGEQGIVYSDGAESMHVPTKPVDGPIDIVGAGDSTTAGLVSSLCSGASPIEAAAVGNLCASVTIRKLGTTGTASRDEVRRALHPGTMG